MTTLAKDTARDLELGELGEYPVIASDIIYEGAAVGLVDATGHVQPLTSSDQFVGFAQRQKDNSDGDAAAVRVITVKRGSAKVAISGAVITDVGQAVYATDDNTFVFTPVGSVFIGFVRRWISSGYVIVEFNAGVLKSPWEGRVCEALAASTKTLDAQDTNKVIACTVTTVITLPVTATALKNVTLLCVGPFGTVEITANPNANDGIMGPDLAGTANKDLVNTAATARRGDFVTINAGHADGYTVEELKGTWAAES
jgi:hypothetical protein